MLYDVFISYSRKDSDVADKIYDALTAEGLTCFIDRTGISGGADFTEVITTAILESKMMLLVASENAYASDFTLKELTFAVSNKGGRFVLPLIVDGSSLPKSVEFLLSNINWRTLSFRYRIEKELVDDVKQKLADPHAGETIKQQEKSSVKKMMTVFYVVLGIITAAVVVLLIRDHNIKAKEAEARSASLQCQRLMGRAQAFIATADSLRDQKDNLNTFNAEIETLAQAEIMISKADSLKQYYDGKGYDMYFSQIDPDSDKRLILNKRDSMFKVWSMYAVNLYNDYKEMPDDINHDIALQYIERALVLKPDNPELVSMKNSLTD